MTLNEDPLAGVVNKALVLQNRAWPKAQPVADAVRAHLIDRLEAEIRPLLEEPPFADGYDCCGCSTYDAILDHAIRIVQGVEAREAAERSRA